MGKNKKKDRTKSNRKTNTSEVPTYATNLPEPIYHVHTQDEGWIIREHGHLKAIKAFPTKSEAIQGAKELVQRGRIVVHFTNGLIDRWIKSPQLAQEPA